MSGGTPNPFEAPSTEAESQHHGPPAGEWAQFLVARSLRLVAMPGGIGLGVAVLRPDLPGWVAVAAALLAAGVWMPTTAWILFTRFLGTRTDPRPVILNRSGEWMDRDIFRQWVRARAAERILGLGLTVPFLAAWAPTIGWMALVPLLLLTVGWATYLVVTNRAAMAYADALVQLMGQEPDEALKLVDWILGRTAVNRALSRAARLLRARALLRQRRIDESLAEVEGVLEQAEDVNARILLAEIAAGRGDITPAVELLSGTHGRGLAIEIGLHTLSGLVAFHTGTGVSFPEPERLRRMPPQVRHQWRLIEAGLAARAGDDARRQVLVHRLPLEELSWTESLWPELWAAATGLAPTLHGTRDVGG